MSDDMQELRDALDDAILGAYAGGSSGEGWMFMGAPIPADEMKARILQDPERMRHASKIADAAWAVIEERVEHA